MKDLNNTNLLIEIEKRMLRKNLSFHRLMVLYLSLGLILIGFSSIANTTFLSIFLVVIGVGMIIFLYPNDKLIRKIFGE